MDSELRNMVMAFRVTELQNLLGHFSKNKNGRKNELQARALELVRVRDRAIISKIQELYRSIQLSLNQPLPASAVLAHQQQQYANPPAMPPGRMFTSGTLNISSEKTLYQNRATWAANGYNGSPPIPGLQSINARLPICPDVRMKPLPFYDIQAELTRTTSLLGNSSGRVQEANFTFFLTPTQAADIASSKEFNNVSTFGEQKVQYSTQVQMRFCALDTGSFQDDLFPPSINIKVNNRSVPLPHPIPSNRPGVEAKRPSRPLNVTNFVKISPTVTNNVNVTWANDASGRDYVISITLVRKLCSQDLLGRLKAKGTRPAEYTKGMIKELVRKDDADCIATTTFKVSVACPLGKCRMTLPCRASTCKHLQCFDANLYLQMNEKKPVWSCPVCDKFTAFEDLAIDGYFEEVILKLRSDGEDVNDIEVLPDGTWKPLKIKKEADEPPAKRMKPAKEEVTICLDDDEIRVISKDGSPSPSVEKRTPKVVEVDLTISSDEESNDGDRSSSSKSVESEDEVIKPPKRKKPEFMIDESSSSSSSASVSTASVSAQSRPRQPPTPDCIILDSPTPSPEPRSDSNQENEPVHQLASAPPLGSTASSSSALSSASYNSVDTLLDSPFNVVPFGMQSTPTLTGGLGLPNDLAGGADQGYSHQNPFLPSPFERASWDGGSFPISSDFSSLDFPSMDYFNQDASSSYTSGGRSGGNGGFGLSRW